MKGRLLLLILVIFSMCSNPESVPEDVSKATTAEIEGYEIKLSNFLSPSKVTLNQKEVLKSKLNGIDSLLMETYTPAYWKVFVDSTVRGGRKVFDYYMVDSKNILKHAYQAVEDSLYDNIRWEGDFRGDSIFHMALTVFSFEFGANVDWGEAYFLPDTTILLGLPEHQKTLLEKKKFLEDTLVKKFREKIVK